MKYIDDIKQLKEHTSEHGKNHHVLNNKLNDLIFQVSGLQTNDRVNSRKLDYLRDRVATLELKVSALPNNLEQFELECAKTRTSLNSSKNKITKAYGDVIEEIKGISLNTLKEVGELINEKIDEKVCLQAELNEDQSKINSMQAELNSYFGTKIERLLILADNRENSFKEQDKRVSDLERKSRKLARILSYRP